MRPAGKLQVQAAKFLPLVGLARSKQDPINLGHGAQYLYRPPPAGAASGFRRVNTLQPACTSLPGALHLQLQEFAAFMGSRDSCAWACMSVPTCCLLGSFLHLARIHVTACCLVLAVACITPLLGVGNLSHINRVQDNQKTVRLSATTN